MKEAEGNWEASRKFSELGSMKKEGWTMFRSGSMKTARHAELAAGEGCFFFLKIQNTIQEPVIACAQLSPFMLQIPRLSALILSCWERRVSILLSGHSGSFSG